MKIAIFNSYAKLPRGYKVYFSIQFQTTNAEFPISELGPSEQFRAALAGSWKIPHVAAAQQVGLYFRYFLGDFAIEHGQRNR